MAPAPNWRTTSKCRPFTSEYNQPDLVLGVKVLLPNSAFLGNIEGFVRKLDTGSPDSMDVEFHPRWISAHPFVLSITASLSAHQLRNGVPTKGAAPNIRSMPYLIRMKLLDFLKIAPPRDITEHESSGRFIPITQIRTSDELHDFITEMIPLLHADPSESDPIKYVMSELVRNVLEHSNSPDGAFICAQYFKESKRVAIGVADTGQGILAHIRRNHAVSTHREAIIHSLRPGVTGTTSRIGGTESNAGAGLFFTRNIAKASNNMFVIYSGTSLYKLRHAKEPRLTLYADATRDPCSIHEGMPHWPGTAIGIDIATTRTRSFSALLQLIREAYSVDVRNGKKAKYKKPRFV